jgi:hypothetical protein
MDEWMEWMDGTSPSSIHPSIHPFIHIQSSPNFFPSPNFLLINVEPKQMDFWEWREKF